MVGFQGKIKRTAVLVGVLVSIAACGFRPLYGARGPGTGMARTLAAIEIAPKSNPLGQIVREYLLENMSPGTSSGGQLYRLDFNVRQEKTIAALEHDESAERYNLVMRVPCRLVRLADDRVMLNGAASATAAYNVVLSDYATLAAERDASARAADRIGEQIHMRLAVYFDRLGGPDGADR